MLKNCVITELKNTLEKIDSAPIEAANKTESSFKETDAKLYIPLVLSIKNNTRPNKT